MLKNVADNQDGKRRTLSPRVSKLLEDRNGLLPVWIRAPITGPEHYTGFTRAKLYELATEGKIVTRSIRDPGAVKGVRLFELVSILNFIETCVQEEAA